MANTPVNGGLPGTKPIENAPGAFDSKGLLNQTNTRDYKSILITAYARLTNVIGVFDLLFVLLVVQFVLTVWGALK